MRVIKIIAVSLFITVTAFVREAESFMSVPTASFVVNSAGDTNDATTLDNLCADASGNCTLRAAIQQANASFGNDTISFALGQPTTINLLYGELLISQGVTIAGPGARNLTVRRSSSAASARVFNVQAESGAVTFFNGLTVAGGSTTGMNFGGGIHVGRVNTLNLSEVTIKENAADVGGGIFNYGVLNIVNSTISHNTATSEGGGIDNNITGTANIANSTISSNRSTNFGGGVWSVGQLTMNNVTVSDNSSNIYGGGVYSEGGSIFTRNTIIAGNSSSYGADVYGMGFATLGNNLVGNPAGSAAFANGVNGDKVGQNAQLGALANNGGQTDTHGLSAVSPALDAGNNCVVNAGCGSNSPVSLTADQRGAGFSRQSNGSVDVGAFESPGSQTSCSYSLGSNFQSFSTTGGNGSFTVTTSSSCSWSAQSNNFWISVTSGSGTGSGTVQFYVQPNSSARTGTITVGGQTFTVNQTAAAYNFTGTVSYGVQPAKFVPDVTLTVPGTPMTTTTDFNGSYLLSGFGNGQYTVMASKAAQTNNNGISLQDASEAARIAFNQNPNATTNQRTAADATGNGSVSLQDASEIARRAFNITGTNLVGQWKFAPASRAYQSVNSNLSGENYEAILVGDVTGNWAPPGGSSRGDIETEETDETEKTEQTISTVEQPEQSSGLNSSAFLSLPTETNQTAEKNLGGVSVSLPNGSGSSGTTVLIPVTVGDLTGLGVTAYDLTVSFDPSVLQPASPAFETIGTLTGAAGGYSTFVDPGQPTGRLRVGAFGTTALSGQGALIFLRFTVVNGGAANSSLNFEQFIFGEGRPQDAQAATSNGSFTRLGPSAASVTVSGRILTANGNGIRNVRITMTDSQGNARTAVSTSFGYYRFEAVAAGETYILTAASKRFTFSQSSQVLNVNDNISDINFVALGKM
jgi:CSLREA domain-containing protein